MRGGIFFVRRERLFFFRLFAFFFSFSAYLWVRRAVFKVFKAQRSFFSGRRTPKQAAEHLKYFVLLLTVW